MLKDINDELRRSCLMLEGEVVDHLKRNWKKYALAAGAVGAYKTYAGPGVKQTKARRGLVKKVKRIGHNIINAGKDAVKTAEKDTSKVDKARFDERMSKPGIWGYKND